MSLVSLFNFLLLALGFGFVIFWHELGHFAAAKWAKVRVEQFAVGFGSAIVSYRKGLGFRRGTSTPEYEAIQQADPSRAESISPTEYRLNYLPLGGYVKMLGQEDLAVPAGGHEPDSYQSKTVGQRMVIISAGVVMNVILAAILFTLLYFVGFSAAAAKIGMVLPGSPAEQAGLQVGDEVVSVNGSPTHDFGKLRLGVALADDDEPSTLVVQPAGTDDPAKRRTLKVRPIADETTGGMLAIGVSPSPILAVPAQVKLDDSADLRQLVGDSPFQLLPGEAIVEVEGQAVGPDDWYLLDRALQRAGDAGTTVDVQVLGRDGTTRRERLKPILSGLANVDTIFGGLRPLLQVQAVAPASLAGSASERDEQGLDVIRPGDVLLRVSVPETGDSTNRPDFEQLKAILDAAGKSDRSIDLLVMRNGAEVQLRDLPLTMLGGGWLSRLTGNVPRGLYANLGRALDAPELATSVAADSPADAAGLSAALEGLVAGSARIVSVNDEPVSTWNDVSRELRGAVASPVGNYSPATRSATLPASTFEVPVTVELAGPGGAETKRFVMPFNSEQISQLRTIRWGTDIAALVPAEATSVQSVRQTYNPLQAMWWGIFETRDQITNLYLTLRRVTVDRTVSPSNLSGPVGILHFGSIVSERGLDWLIWFLAMLSANLAVVNFLPIPILDGGHMVFLLWEKLTGRAPSRKVQEGALYVGLALLGCFLIFVTFNDLSRLVTL